MASTLLYSKQRPPFCKGNPITLKYAILDDASFVTQVAPCKAKSQKPAFSVFQFTNVATAHCVGWKFSYFNFFVKFLPPLSLFKKDLDCRMASFHEKSYSVTIALCLVLCLLGTNVAQAAVQSDTGRICHDQKTNVVKFLNLESQPQIKCILFPINIWYVLM